MSNYPPVPKRFRRIDETNKDEYTYIAQDDVCLYIWERMSQVKVGEWDQYPANSLISNIQIALSVEAVNPARFRHKAGGINYAAQALGKLLGELLGGMRDDVTYVPIPPSKVVQDPQYDARVLRILNGIHPQLPDIRELVLLNDNCQAKQKGITPEARAKNYRINEDVAGKDPDVIMLFDDVLTTGCHFKAIKIVLQDRFPRTEVFGIFLTRAVRPPQVDTLKSPFK